MRTSQERVSSSGTGLDSRRRSELLWPDCPRQVTAQPQTKQWMHNIDFRDVAKVNAADRNIGQVRPSARACCRGWHQSQSAIRPPRKAIIDRQRRSPASTARGPIGGYRSGGTNGVRRDENANVTPYGDYRDITNAAYQGEHADPSRSRVGENSDRSSDSSRQQHFYRGATNIFGYAGLAHGAQKATISSRAFRGIGKS